MLFNCPISKQRADEIISLLNLSSTSKVIDVGCGEGEFLSRVKQKFNADCLGIDIDSSALEIAEKNVQKFSQSTKPRFLLSDIQKAQLENSSHDLAVCMGSTHAFGSGRVAYSNALQEMNKLVKPNGLILIGEGYWKRNPEQEYLDFIGEPVGIYNDHEENIKQAESLGLISMYAATSSLEEWDYFEWCFKMKAERLAIAEPDNEQVQSKLERIREWNQYYRKFGRTTMGFGFYLFLKSDVSKT